MKLSQLRQAAKQQFSEDQKKRVKELRAQGLDEGEAILTVALQQPLLKVG